MTNAVLADVALPFFMRQLVGLGMSGWVDWELQLFSNNVIITPDTVYADLHQCDFTGYSPVDMTRSKWQGFTVTDHNCEATWGSTPERWICTALSNVVYGYMMFDVANGILRCAENVDPPIPVSTGVTIGVLPRLKLFGQLCPTP